MKKITYLIVALLAFTAHSYAQFPSPYCGPITWEYDSEPITLVNFAGLDNNSAADIATGIAHEDYTLMIANVDAGASYSIVLKGNTGGSWTDYFSVFFDWNQDNDFDDAGESYDIGTILNSTGLDAVQVTGMIVVPPDAMGGTTRMRVVKSFASYADACNASALGFGQAEDYSVLVTIPACVAPTGLTATAITSTSATISWTAPATAPANGYDYYYSTTNDSPTATTTASGSVAAGILTADLSGLPAATLTYVWVRSICGAGDESAWTGPFTINTTQLPGCVSNPSPADGATNVTVGPVTLTWDVPTTGDPVDFYDLYSGDSPTTVTTLVGTYNTNTTGTALVINNYNAVVYWKIVPKNSAGSATGCPVWSFTTEAAPGYCLSAPSGQYPTGTEGYTAATCDGTSVNSITTAGYAGEYSLVNVTDGQTYQFLSSNPTDFVTISNAAGTTSLVAGTTPVTWVSNLTGQVRFYTHVDDQCTSSTTFRSRSIICGVASTDTPDYANLQWPATISITQGGSDTVYGQVYEAGLTDVAPNIDGQTPGIMAWVGISPVGQDTDPATWTNWIPATHNAEYVGNNDEYMAVIGATLAPGTYYYATRFTLNNGPYVYGGFEGGFWDGTTNVSGVLTVTPPPAPANDECSGAIALTPGGVFSTYPQTGTVFGATTVTGLTYSCQSNRSLDVWYSVVVPASGNITIQTALAPGSLLTDTVLSVFSGACGSLTEIGCDDDDTTNNFSTVALTGQTPGSTLYVGVWKWSSASSGEFQVSAFDASLANTTFDNASFAYYPNPVKNTLNLSYSKNITNVSVFNLLGQEVIARPINSNEGQIDMSKLASGTYMVKVTADNQTKTIKVIKE